MTKIATVCILLLTAFIGAILGSADDATWPEKLFWIAGMALVFGCLVAIGREP